MYFSLIPYSEDPIQNLLFYKIFSKIMVNIKNHEQATNNYLVF